MTEVKIEVGQVWVSNEYETDAVIFGYYNGLVYLEHQPGMSSSIPRNRLQEFYTLKPVKGNKMKKTIIDAVNELRGDLLNIMQPDCVAGYIACDGKYFCRTYCKSDEWCRVCTIEAFNRCIAELSAWQPTIKEESMEDKTQYFGEDYPKGVEMKTVGYFKKAGLVFVEGDKVTGITGNYDSGVNNLINECCIDCPAGDVDVEVSANKFAHPNWTIAAFAWRTNSGVKPEFDGLVEVEYRDGSTFISGVDKFRWKLSTHTDLPRSHLYDDDVIKWRPHLPAEIPTQTPEEKVELDLLEKRNELNLFQGATEEEIKRGCRVIDKPVFTKEMADAGDTVEVGMLFATECGEYEAVCVNNKSIVFSDECGWLVSIPKGKAKPIPTEREKAIESCMAVGELRARDGAEEVYGRLYDAGLLK